MKYPKEVRETVLDLRKSGKTFSEIRSLLKLKIPKGTLSGWCAEVRLTSEYFSKIERLNRESLLRAQFKAKEINKEKRQKFLDGIRRESLRLVSKAKFNKKILKLILAFLYLGEGAKWKSHPGLQLGSSDPLIVKLYLRLLYLCYGIKAEQLKCRVSFRADQDLASLEQFWSSETAIPINNFYKSVPDPRTRGKITKNVDYKGVCVINGGSTSIQLELEMIPKALIMGL